MSGDAPLQWPAAPSALGHRQISGHEESSRQTALISSDSGQWLAGGGGLWRQWVEGTVHGARIQRTAVPARALSLVLLVEALGASDFTSLNGLQFPPP